MFRKKIIVLLLSVVGFSFCHAQETDQNGLIDPHINMERYARENEAVKAAQYLMYWTAFQLEGLHKALQAAGSQKTTKVAPSLNQAIEINPSRYERSGAANYSARIMQEWLMVELKNLHAAIADLRRSKE